MAQVLALDVGTRTIGVARADLRVGMPSPLTTLKRVSVQVDVQKLAHLCREQRAVELVVGLPTQLDGAEGRSARLARQVGDALGALTGLPLHYQDEQFSTLAAEELLRAGGLGARDRRARIDQAAAAVILGDWLAARRAAPP
jgi:putative holliday junction resolvase